MTTTSSTRRVSGRSRPAPANALVHTSLGKRLRLAWAGPCAAAFVAAVLSGACGSPSNPTPVPPTPDPPTLTCPADASVDSPDWTEKTVTYPAPTVVNGSAPVTTTCSPTSGTNFPLGTTAVTCTATDALSRIATCKFAVKVNPTPKLSVTHFLAFGDSMTAGVIPDTFAPYRLRLVAPSTSYPSVLAAKLQARYTTQTFIVDNQGQPGEEAVDGMRRIRGVLDYYAPEAVLLLEGANDVADLGGEAVDTVTASMLEMIWEAEQRNVKPFVATLPPQRPGGFRSARYYFVVPDVNASLTKLAAERGATLVDLYTAFGGVATDELIGWDGMHPTAAGYELIAETFLQAIKGKLEVAPPVAGSFRSTAPTILRQSIQQTPSNRAPNAPARRPAPPVR